MTNKELKEKIKNYPDEATLYIEVEYAGKVQNIKMIDIKLDSIDVIVIS